MDAREMGQEIVGLLPRLRRFAMSLTRSVPDAEDLVQAAIERALSRTDQFGPEGRLDLWLFRILRTVWLNMNRSTKLRRTEQIEEHENEAVVDGIRNAEAGLELQSVRAAFLNLPVEQREPLLLVCVEGLSYAEAAVLLGIPLGTLTSRLVRGRAALSAALADPDPNNVTLLRGKGKP